MQSTEHHRRGYDELSSRGRSATHYDLLGFTQLGQDAPRAIQEGGPVIGQRHCAGRPVKECDAKMPFQRSNGASNGGRRRSKRPPCGGETTLIGHGNKGREGLEPVHYSSNCNSAWRLSRIICPAATRYVAFTWLRHSFTPCSAQAPELCRRLRDHAHLMRGWKPMPARWTC
jgi:hypothetical protein